MPITFPWNQRGELVYFPAVEIRIAFTAKKKKIIKYKKKVEKHNADDHKTTPNRHTNVAILWATLKAHKKDRF